MPDWSAADLPRLRARYVLFDVDGTIVETRADSGGDVFQRVLEELVARERSVDAAEARRLVRSVCDPARQCISSALQPLGISEQGYLAMLLPALRQTTRVHPDAADAIEALAANGFALFPATTNSGFAIRAKLASDGEHPRLAGCFSRLIGGAEVCPEGKTGPGFYRSLIDRLAIDPALTVMVGDDPKTDLLFAREAGIAAALIVRRAQAAEWTSENDDGVHIRSLALLPRMLQLAA